MFVLFADATDAHSSEIYNAAVGDDSPSDRRRMACGLCSLFSFLFIIFLLFFILLLDHVFSSLSLFQTNGHLLLLFRRSVAYYRNGVQFSIYSKTSFLTFFFICLFDRYLFTQMNNDSSSMDLRFPLPISFMDIMTRKWPLAKAVYIEHQILYNSSTIIYILPRLSSSASSSLSALFTHIRLILYTFSTLQRRPSKRRPNFCAFWFGWQMAGRMLSEISWRL